ncbi:hypothetical protein EG329_003533 [Mollisiaceae sp. DMI_Dod_QoI]|nr:hypothetical protein EG329_003533 [Helotiales sp. DMI_Dod_QoI]
METINTKVHQLLNSTSGKGKTILITGGSGFIAAHVINAFLSRGYNVRTTVRSQATAERVKLEHADNLDRLSFAIVPDLQTPGGHDEAVKGVDGVIHTASPFVLQVEDNERDLLKPAVNGTTSVLTSIQKYNPNVKRVVITSSFASIVDMDKGVRPGYTYSEKDWNPVTYETASNKDTNGAIAYCASKTFAERAAFDFVAKNKPNFNISTILPPMVYGPAAHTINNLDHMNTSSADIYRLMNGSLKEVPETAFYPYVDVRDVGEAHARAYEYAEGAGQRYFVAAGRFTYNIICQIILKNFPELKERIPEPKDVPFPDVYLVNNEKVKTELGMSFIDLETCIVDQVKEFLALEEKSKK